MGFDMTKPEEDIEREDPTLTKMAKAFQQAAAQPVTWVDAKRGMRAAIKASDLPEQLATAKKQSLENGKFICKQRKQLKEQDDQLKGMACDHEDTIMKLIRATTKEEELQTAIDFLGEENEYIKEENTELQKKYDAYFIEVTAIIASQKIQLKEQRAALEYYADDENYEPFMTLGGERPAPIRSKVAKAALKHKGE